jgi:hypothetical protein
MKIHSKREYPMRATDLKGLAHAFSVTVITCNYSEDAISDSTWDLYLNLGYWNYDTQEWLFHSDTMMDMDDVEFFWFYPPNEIIREANKAFKGPEKVVDLNLLKGYYQIQAIYSIAVKANSGEKAKEVVLESLADNIARVVDCIPEEAEQYQLAQVFDWTCKEMGEIVDESALEPEEKALLFLKEYKELCRKYGLIVESDNYDEPVIYLAKDKLEIVSYFDKIRIV